MKEAADILVKLSSDKKRHREAMTFFLDRINGRYDALLWKCYSAHMAKKDSLCSATERIALLGSSNVAPLRDMMRPVFHANGVKTEFYTGEYGNYLREMISDGSALDSFAPTITVLVLGAQDIVPSLYEDPLSRDARSIGEILSKAAADIAVALDSYAEKKAENTTYIMVVPACEDPYSYIYNPGPSYNGGHYSAKLEDSLWERLNGKDNVIFLNSGNILSRYPKNEIEDKRYWYLGRIRYSDIFFSEAAREVARVYRMARYPSKKCLITDLDNTLWGGVVGQDGLENIALGQDGLGSAFQDFQREMLKLHRKGIMLAVCSKNNEKDALEVFEKHPGMILKKEHLASSRINWADKVTNIKEIAAELNIGLDSMVFLDDDAAEKKWVRDNLPQVTVPDLPQDQFMYADFLKRSGWFDSVRLSEEDASRNASYKAIARTKDLKLSSGGEEEFLKSLGQSVEIERLSPGSLSRAVQLCQKTNQFNLTTKRYQAPDLKEMSGRKNCHVYTVKVKDCFCDYGIVGLMILKESSPEVAIDTFLLSCRIIGRGIEAALLDRIKLAYRKKGFKRIKGAYIKTEKNAVSADLYDRNGFKPLSRGRNGDADYCCDLGGKIKASRFSKLINIKA